MAVAHGVEARGMAAIHRGPQLPNRLRLGDAWGLGIRLHAPLVGMLQGFRV